MPEEQNIKDELREKFIGLADQLDSLGWTNQAIADRIDVTKQFVGQVRNRISFPSIPVMKDMEELVAEVVHGKFKYPNAPGEMMVVGETPDVHDGQIKLAAIQKNSPQDFEALKRTIDTTFSATQKRHKAPVKPQTIKKAVAGHFLAVEAAGKKKPLKYKLSRKAASTSGNRHGQAPHTDRQSQLPSKDEAEAPK